MLNGIDIKFGEFDFLTLSQGKMKIVCFLKITQSMYR